MGSKDCSVSGNWARVGDMEFGLTDHKWRLANNKQDIILGKTQEEMRVDAIGQFIDEYKFEVKYEPLNFDNIIDLSSKKDRYADKYIDGSLKSKSRIGGVDNYYELVPKDIDNDGVMEIIGGQYIFGNGRSDCMGSFRSVQKWDPVNNKWKVLKVAVMSDFKNDDSWYK